MLESSKDILWIVLAFAILWISIFVGWSIYYFAMIMRDMRKITTSLRKKLDLVDQILNIIKKKTEATANYLPPLIEGMGKLVKHFKDKKGDSKMADIVTKKKASKKKK